MDKQNFKNLLTDLYNVYNPANLEYVDDLVERYSRHEFDAVQNIFFKYNRKSASYYDPEIGTDKYIHALIKEYESGMRTLESVDLKVLHQKKVGELKKQEEEKNKLLKEKEKQNKEKEFEKIAKLQEDVKTEVTGEVEKKLKMIEQSFAEKELSIKNTLDNLYEDFEKKLSALTKEHDDVVVRIFSSYSDSELDLPNKKQIAGLGKGSRLLLKDKDGKVVGMEIVDIVYDAVSYENEKPLIEIFLEKA